MVATKLTTVVFGRTTDTILVCGSTSWYLQSAVVAHTLGAIVDAVAHVTRLIGVQLHLGSFVVHLTIDVATCLQYIWVTTKHGMAESGTVGVHVQTCTNMYNTGPIELS